MRLIVVNHDPDRPVRDDAETWHTTTRIGRTYAAVALTALKEHWDETVVVMQDDVVCGSLPEAEGFTIYGYEQDGHVCPRAFAAPPEIWELLYEAWRRYPRSLCPSFTRLAREGTVLNTCR